MPAKKTILTLLVILSMGTIIHAQSKGTIVFVSYQVDTKIDPVTQEYPDMPHIYALQDAGYEVNIFYNETLSTADPATLDTLFNANLIVMGRSTPSIPYQTNKLDWNELPTPILNLELWNCRGSRLNWFNTETMLSLTDEGTVYNAIIDVPDDPVFEGLDTSAPVPWVIGPMDAVGVKDAGYGTVLARMETDSTVLFVRFEPDVEFYDGSGDFPAGHRTLLGNGRDLNGGEPFNYYNFTFESEQVFLAEVARLVALGGGGSAVENQENTTAPTEFTLSQNYPNPFNQATTIEYTLLNDVNIEIKIMDLIGREIQTLVAGEHSAGTYRVTWNGLDADSFPVVSGVYFCKMTAAGFTETRKLLLVR